jgi:hypothetical protein
LQDVAPDAVGSLKRFGSGDASSASLPPALQQALQSAQDHVSFVFLESSLSKKMQKLEAFSRLKSLVVQFDSHQVLVSHRYAPIVLMIIGLQSMNTGKF